MTTPLLQIRNQHTAASGDPPVVDGVSGKTYIGYFENQFGEQWIFTRDLQTGQVILRGGDIGWNEELDVSSGEPSVTLTPEESLWLQACLLASQSRNLQS